MSFLYTYKPHRIISRSELAPLASRIRADTLLYRVPCVRFLYPAFTRSGSIFVISSCLLPVTGNISHAALCSRACAEFVIAIIDHSMWLQGFAIMFSFKAFYFFTIIGSARLITCIPLTTSPPLVLPSSSNTTFPILRNLQCIDSPDWATPHFLASDCYTAIDKFVNREVMVHGNRFPLLSAPSSDLTKFYIAGGTIYEFLSRGMSPAYPRFAQTTPRRYKYKTCTMAIVMLVDLPGGAVPG